MFDSKVFARICDQVSILRDGSSSRLTIGGSTLEDYYQPLLNLGYKKFQQRDNLIVCGVSGTPRYTVKSSFKRRSLAEKSVSPLTLSTEIRATKHFFELKLPYDKIVSLTLIAVCGLLGFVLIPCYPFSLSAILVIALVAISFKNSQIGILGLFFLLSIALGYQFGAVAGFRLGIISFLTYICIAIIVSLSADTMSIAVSSTLGLLCSLLMLTPFFVLSVPLLISFAKIFPKIGKGTSITIFLQYYLPLQILSSTSNAVQQGSILPILYGSVAPKFYRSLDVLTWDNFWNSIGNTGKPLIGGPIDFPHWTFQYLIGSATVIAFVIIISCAILAAFLSEDFIVGYVKKSGLALKQFDISIMFISILLGCSVFAAPLVALGGPIGYTTGLSNTLLLYFAVSFGGAGATTGVRLYMRQREITSILQKKLEDDIKRLKNLAKDIGDRTEKAKLVCTKIKVQGLQARIEEIVTDLDISLSTLSGLSMRAAKDKSIKFEEYEKTLQNMDNQLKELVVDYYLQNSLEFSDMTKRTAAIGIELPVAVDVPSEEEATAKDVDALLRAEQELEQKVEQNLKQLYETTEKLYNLIKTNFDSEFKLSQIEIAGSFLDQKDYKMSVETFLECLELMNQRYSKITVELADSTKEMAKELFDALSSKLKPLSERAWALDLKQELKALSDSEGIMQEIKATNIVDLIQVLELKEKLVHAFLAVTKMLDEKIRTVGDEVNKKVPSKYAWGKDDQIHGTIARSVREVEENSTKGGRVSLTLLR